MNTGLTDSRPRTRLTATQTAFPTPGMCITTTRTAILQRRTMFQSFFYNTKGKLVKVTRDTDMDGTANTQRTYEYDNNGFLAREEFDEDMDGTPFELYTHTRNELGQRLASTILVGGIGATLIENTYEYNKNNQRSEERRVGKECRAGVRT